MSLLCLPPLSLYVHIPWCVRKCPYCDFNSHAAGGEPPEDEYCAALIADLEWDLDLARGRTLQSVFFGGGTPSLFSPRAIGRIVEAIASRLDLAADAEITLEANPGTLGGARLRGYRAAGINRISLGVQSFNGRHLARLGRIHDAAQAISSAEALHGAGFDNFNLDLMHGLPEQREVEALADIEQALALGPSHISWYQLTIEPNTEFYRRPPALPVETELGAIQQAGHRALTDAGFRAYEVSAYARAGRASVHNRNYWGFGDYLGIGAGAHSKLSDPESGTIWRGRKTRMPNHYLAATSGFYAARWQIEAADLPLEFMMNALRLHDGVPAGWFESRCGLPLSTIENAWTQLEGSGLAEPLSPGRLALTAFGQRYLDSVLERF